MQITQTKKEKLKCEFTVKLSADEIDQKVSEKLQEIGKTISLPGFRPGKVPLTLLKSKYGKAVMGEVLDGAVNDSTLKAINENNLRPAMRPKIEVKTFDEKSGLEYTMAIELLPEIKVMDFSELKLEKLTAKPDTKAIKETLERIANSNKASEKVEEKRGAKKDEIVVIDFDGTVNGEPFPGMKGNDFPLELGSKSFIDTFEDQLIGAKVGDHKTVKVTFPKDYGQEKLRGVAAVFEVDVKELRVPTAPKLDDTFAKTLGFDSLTKAEEAVEKQMQTEYDQVARMNIKRSLLDVLDEKHEFEVPAGMVDAEFYGIWRQLKGHAHHQDPCHVHGAECDHDHDQVTAGESEEYRAIAHRRVKLGLVLAEVGRISKIEVTNQELQQAVIAEARRYPGKERQVFEFYQKNSDAVEGLKAPIFEDKVVDSILERAHISDSQVSIEELTKAAEQDGSDSASGKSSGGSDKKKETKKSGKK
ncbi:MAG: trigger factor [Proteobacteria bacterium]|nr:trigger factor [Pseudomonadota bacterium]